MDREEEVIPTEAIAAAAKELQMEDGHSVHFSRYLRMARLSLEAAAPHMLADAWDEGFQYACDNDLRVNPYQQAEDSFADRMAKRSLDAVKHESWKAK